MLLDHSLKGSCESAESRKKILPENLFVASAAGVYWGSLPVCNEYQKLVMMTRKCHNHRLQTIQRRILQFVQLFALLLFGNFRFYLSIFIPNLRFNIQIQSRLHLLFKYVLNIPSSKTCRQFSSKICNITAC